jgi:hypothetical protein
MTDFVLYLSAQKGDAYNLSLFPQMARVRWPWIVSQWDKTLRGVVEPQTQGDDFLKGLLSRFENDIRVVQLGATSFNPFDDSVRTSNYKPLLELMPLTLFKLTDDELSLVREEVARVNALTITDFRNMTQYLRSECALAAQRIGLGDDDAEQVFGYGEVEAQRTYTIGDLDTISSALDLADVIDGVVFGLDNTVSRTPDLLTVANRNIDPTSGVTVRSDYVSSVAVPFESSLEAMAQRYLGDAAQWFELVTINNLQAPFVDLSGTKVSLLATGSGSVVRISDTIKAQVPVGTKVRIGSARYKEESRYVERYVDNLDGTLTLELSGESDLARFTTRELAYLRVYAPHTVNELSLILVPTTLTPGYTRQPVPSADALKRLDESLLAFGVDVKRDDQTGDFVVGGSGDFELVYGVPAIRQAVLYALKTNQGELPWHQRYGITSNIGDIFVGGVDDGIVFAQALQKSLMQDQRYQEVTLIDVRATPNSISLDFTVKIVGNDTVVPLSFTG